MEAVKNLFVQLGKDEEGVTMLEYILIAALIAAVCMGGFATLGTTGNTKLGNINTQIGAP